MSFGLNTPKLPDPPKKLAGLDADLINTNQEAIPVPYFAGRRRIALKWHTPAYNQINEAIKTKTGKDSSTTTGWIYYVDLAGLICVTGRRVTLNRIFKHIVDNEDLWKNESGLVRDEDPYEPIAIPKFAATRVYWGGADQPVDTLVLTPIGPRPGDPGFNPRVPSTWPNYDQTTQHPEP